MAFQQPILAPSRPDLTVSDSNNGPQRVSYAQQAQPEKSQEWVLFDRQSDAQTLSTAYTPQTAGLSRLSEFGSLGAAAVFGHSNGDDHTPEDDEELNSLDEGLHAFDGHMNDQEYGNAYQDGSILPTHDGLGTFPSTSHPVQEHLWHFERFNPRRRSLGHHRRRSSIQRRLDALEVDDGMRLEVERTDRIERWRIEHSRILLEEVKKESRRKLGCRKSSPTATTLEVPMEVSNNSASATPSPPDGITTSTLDTENLNNTENVWRQIIRKLVRDLLGIDETILALISGEALPEEGRAQLDSPATGSEAPNQSFALRSNPKWSLTLLDRLSQNLASVLRQIYYIPATIASPIDPKTLDYAGIPIVGLDVRQRKASPSAQTVELEVEDELPPAPVFRPTLAKRSISAASDIGHAALWGIEEETEPATQDRDYWEQTPSLRTVFRLLHQHFTSRRRPMQTTSAFSSSKPSNVATTSTADSLRRAAVIRKHHPLVSSQQARRTATTNLLSLGHRQYSSHSIRNLPSPLFKRSESSCASISARNNRKGSGSSRNYWDLGGSIGSGSVGGIGVWGEV